MWFYDSWQDLIRIAVITVFTYTALVTMLRVSGKRTLSKMNAFDLVVTVALGSTLAATVLNDSVPLLNGMTAFFMLIGTQWIVAWTCARSSKADQIVKSTPTILLWKGQIFGDVMKRERVSEEELLCSLRQAGYGSFGDVGAAVLETTGDISIISDDMNDRTISKPGDRQHDTLRGVNGYAGDDTQRISRREALSDVSD